MRCSDVIARLVALVVTFAVAGAAFGAGGGAPGSAADLDRSTPRSTILGFLGAARAGDYQDAARYLDLRRIPPAGRDARGPVLARKLALVLEQTGAVDPEVVSSEPAGDVDDGLPRNTERVGTVVTSRRSAAVLLTRGAEPGGGGWNVAAVTVAQAPALYEDLGYAVLDVVLPRALVEIRVLDLALWQWIALLALVIVAWGASYLVTRIIVRALQPLVRRSRTTLDEALLAGGVAPLRLAVALVLFSGGVLLLALPAPVQRILAGVEKAGALVAVAWFLLRVVDLLARVTAEQLAAQGRTAAVAVVPVGSKAVKAVVVGLAGLAILQNVGVNVTGILAGLGIGGLAVALAAQKTVENLFGGMTLALDQPVRVGDFCRFGDRVGTVEEIGLRSTRIRTLDRTVVSVPNAEFSALQLENFARRDRIWLHPQIGLRYETTLDQLRWVLVEIRKMLYAHPMVDPDPARIRFVGFGAYSLDLEIFAYVSTQDYGEFLAVREDIYLRIMDIVAASGTGFAFPSQTTYFARDGGLDPTRSRAAEEAVRAWRDRGTLHIPEFPAAEVAALRGSLEYPPGRRDTDSDGRTSGG